MQAIKVHCTHCGKEFIETQSWKIARFRETGRDYCSRECSKEFMKKISSETMSKTNKKYASKRMLERNPMFKEETRKKVSESLKKIHHKPIVQGGNGKPLPEAEKKLLEILQPLGFVSQCVVRTGHWRDGIYPTCYKIDVGNPLLKIGVEADGTSHENPKRRLLDKKKDSFLSGLGWTVLRYKNKYIMENHQEILSTILKLINSTLT